MTLQNMYLKNRALTDLNSITPSDSIIIVGDGTKFVGESGATLRTSIGVGTGDTLDLTGLRVLASGSASTAGSAAPDVATLEGTNDVSLTGSLGNVGILSTDAQNIDVGGTLALGGRYLDASQVVTAFGGISGRKENNTSNNLDGYFAIYTNAAGSVAEKVRVTSNGRVGVNDTNPAEMIDVGGNINVTGVYLVDDVQVVSNRVVDARADDVINSGDATTDGVIDALRDAMITHGLIAAA